MDQNQNQNDNLFNFDSQQTNPPTENEPTGVTGAAQAYEAPKAEEPVYTPPAYTPPPPAFTPPPPPPQQPSKMNRTWLIVIIVLVVLCCCCLATAVSGYLWWGDALMKSLGIY
jgi:hypothetical protein